MAAPGHGDVRRGSTCRLPDHQVSGIDGVALSAVHGGGVGELDVFGDVGPGEFPVTGAPEDEQAAVVTDAGDDPGVAVGDSEVAIVTTGGDAVTEADALAMPGDRLTISLTTVRPGVADRCVEGADLFAGVGDDPSWSTPISASAAVRSTSVACRVIEPRATRESKTSPVRSPVRMSRLSSA